MEKKIIFGKMPIRKVSKVKPRLRIKGGVSKGHLPIPQADVNPGIGFDRAIELDGAALKRKYPHNAVSIDRKVADLQKQYTAAQIHDWYDTQQELLTAAVQPVRKPRSNGKRAGEKR
jgi:hypothetical protein